MCELSVFFPLTTILFSSIRFNYMNRFILKGFCATFLNTVWVCKTYVVAGVVLCKWRTQGINMVQAKTKHSIYVREMWEVDTIGFHVFIDDTPVYSITTIFIMHKVCQRCRRD